MYTVKDSSEKFARYDSEHGDRSLVRLELASDLRDALNDDQFVLHYQPQVNIKTGNIDKLEALIRWNHPKKGMLYPNAFIQLAEQTGFISRLTEWVVKTAISQLSDWARQGRDIGISLNVSVVDILDLGLPELIRRETARVNIEPAKITLEITESVLMLYTRQGIDVLKTLRDLGVNISIDDFGTGYSSLQHLKELPVAELKIDKSFVIDMIEDEDDAVIVRSIIDLAHNLGLSVVAEGIEGEETLNIIQVLGCDYGQGFHISRPVSASDVSAHLEQKG
jgi:EAL domain-containing protein (putative c-di-GMP-specific phosphodiesterase class I)